MAIKTVRQILHCDGMARELGGDENFSILLIQVRLQTFENRIVGGSKVLLVPLAQARQHANIMLVALLDAHIRAQVEPRGFLELLPQSINVVDRDIGRVAWGTKVDCKVDSKVRLLESKTEV